MDNQEKAKKFFLEGINLFIKEEFDQAIIEFKKSLELQPKRGSIILNLSKTYFKVKNYIKSVADQDISIIATEKIDSITLDGLQYTMKNQILNPSARAICNKTIANEFYVESTGKVLVILNHMD